MEYHDDPSERFASAMGDSVTPFLFWNELKVRAGWAKPACPQCAGPNLHLDAIHFAALTRISTQQVRRKVQTSS